MTQEEVRWRYRFANFSRAYALLRGALEGGVGPLNQLEREGAARRFNFAFAASWNLLKDRMEYDGLAIPTATPRAVIREAFAAKLIDDCETWIDMLTDRNRMSHTYDAAAFNAVVQRAHDRYLSVLNDLYQRLAPDAMEP